MIRSHSLDLPRPFSEVPKRLTRSFGDLPKVEKRTEKAVEPALAQFSWFHMGKTIAFSAMVVFSTMAIAYVCISVALPILLVSHPLVAIGFGLVLGTSLALPLMLYLSDDPAVEN